MNSGVKIILSIVAIAIVIFVAWMAFAGPDGFQGEVPMADRFSNKIVYDNEPADVDRESYIATLQNDCRARAGQFNECGSPCAPDAEVCVEVCAYTCELGNQNDNSNDSDQVSIDQCPQTAAFSDYPIQGEVYSGEVAEVDFSTESDARNFMTRIQESVNDGVNFAGHFVVASWGCGTNCGGHAIINARNGEIVDYGLVSSYGLAYREDSRLLVVNPQNNLPDNPDALFEGLETHYFVMENNQLAKICARDARTQRVVDEEDNI